MPMNERVKKLSEEIRKLSPDEQADLMDELLVLTHREPDPEIEKAWAEEAKRRWQDYLDAKTKTVPVDEVFARLGKRHGKAR